jgi:hypothetical protein
VSKHEQTTKKAVPGVFQEVSGLAGEAKAGSPPESGAGSKEGSCYKKTVTAEPQEGAEDAD